VTVFGQDAAIDSLSTAIKLSRAGLKSPDKPVGSFLFAGPTGVGKTEAARQLAKALGVELVRFDMSEYMERHTVSRLIGAPPGYVGFDQGGLLTEAITKQPHCVLLLDEIEKAHPEVFNLLLQVMDHGTLTDNNGRKADFRNVIVIMTTNAGAETRRGPRSVSPSGSLFRCHGSDQEELHAGVPQPSGHHHPVWSPQSRGYQERGGQVPHRASGAAGRQACAAGSYRCGARLAGGRWLRRAMGARPMARLIQDKIKRPLAEEILFGELAEHGGVVHIDIKDGELTFEFETTLKWLDVTVKAKRRRGAFAVCQMYACLVGASLLACVMQ
jgi:ATP-dependent Clp protease ATP-binding subunit ClpA